MSGRGEGKRPIIIVKKAHKGHEHHGGSWKVAYADFVTAMMAFFLVMWIMGMDTHAKDLIEGYFSNPIGFKKAYGGGQNPVSTGSAQKVDLKMVSLLARQYQRERFKEVVEQIRGKLAENPELKALRGQIDFIITSEGLRIELLEREEGETFFNSGSAQIKPAARHALVVIAEALRDLPNQVILEGHTDARPYGTGSYTNWELSVDRANAARRALLAGGLPSGAIAEVRGYADRNLRITTDPFAAANRRVTILLPYQEPHDLPEPGKLPGDEGVQLPPESGADAGDPAPLQLPGDTLAIPTARR